VGGVRVSRIASVVVRRPLTTYFLLTYAVSWTAWKACDRLFARGEVAAVPFIMLGIFGPGLAGILLSGIAAPGTGERRRVGSPTAFVLAWLGSTPLIVMNQVFADGRPLSAATVAASVAAALMPASVVSAIFSRIPGIRQHLASLVRPRGPVIYYPLALVLFAAIWSIGATLSRGVGLPVPQRAVPAEAARIGLLGGITLQFVYNFLLNGLSEEVGWRGFALPRLQARYSPLTASAILWVFWSAWHVPAYLGGVAPQSLENTLVELVLILPVTILFTWFYNRTGGSLLAVALLHPAMNTATHFLPVTLGGLVILATCAAFAVTCDRMWRNS
jgi:uncharacterized protein